MTLEDSVRRHRLAILQRAALLGNATQACREAGISRTLFYRWRRRYLRYGTDGLRPRPTRPARWPRQTVPALEHQVLAYALLWPTHGPARIAMQLRQPLWGGWHISGSGVYAILRRHGLQTRWERLTRLEARAVTCPVGPASAPPRERLLSFAVSKDGNPYAWFILNPICHVTRSLPGIKPWFRSSTRRSPILPAEAATGWLAAPDAVSVA